MHLKSSIIHILAMIVLLAPVAALADSWSCSQGNDVREVHIVRSPPNPVPCEVLYRKLTEGVEDQVLWNAQHDASYCDDKARGLVSKLESFGWVCVETIRDESDVVASSNN